MCGIFGWQLRDKAQLPAGSWEAFTNALAVANSARGQDSWGILAIEPNGRCTIDKDVGSIIHVPMTRYNKMATVMGHTRYPTKGDVTKDNAHPFQVGKVILSHNGMVSNHDELDKKYNRACAVDSMHLAHHLAEDREFKDIEGYGAIEWVERTRPYALFLSRLRNGSLAAAGINGPNGKQMATAWSSDKNHLREAIEAARLEAFMYEPFKEGEVSMVSKGKLFETKRPKLELKAYSYVSYTTGPGTRGRVYYPKGVSTQYGYQGHFNNNNVKPEESIVACDAAEPQADGPSFSAFLKKNGLTARDDGSFVDAKGHVVTVDEAEMLMWLADETGESGSAKFESAEEALTNAIMDRARAVEEAARAAKE